MGLFKLMFLPMRMLMWPVKAPCHMIMRPFKMAFHFVTVMLLVAQLMVMLFMVAMLVMFTVVPTLMYGLYWVMKKTRMGKMGKHRMHMRLPSPRHFKP
jgi:hypothetical protein